MHHDLWDYDVASPPALFTVKRDGRVVRGVAVGSKTGHLFLLQRETGQPLFPVEERPVSKSDVPGEHAASTQPFPTSPPSPVPQRLNAVDLASGGIRWQVPWATFRCRAHCPNGDRSTWAVRWLQGGLLFIGASLDPAIRAFDLDSGAELWKGALPASARSTPMTFEAPGGRQYVIIAAGGHDPKFGKLDNAVVAFTLP